MKSTSNFQQEHQILSCLVHHIMFKVIKLRDSLQYDKSSTWHHVIEFRWILDVWRIHSSLCLPEQNLTCTLAGTEHLIHNVRLSTCRQNISLPLQFGNFYFQHLFFKVIVTHWLIVTKNIMTMKRALSFLCCLGVSFLRPFTNQRLRLWQRFLHEVQHQMVHACHHFLAATFWDKFFIVWKRPAKGVQDIIKQFCMRNCQNMSKDSSNCPQLLSIQKGQKATFYHWTNIEKYRKRMEKTRLCKFNDRRCSKHDGRYETCPCSRTGPSDTAWQVPRIHDSLRDKISTTKKTEVHYGFIHTYLKKGGRYLSYYFYMHIYIYVYI